MGKRNKFYLSLILLSAFALFTAAVCIVDVRAVGPLGGEVGFASVNLAFHKFTGVHLRLYELTDALSVIPIGTAAVFAAMGAVQLVRRKSLFKVDFDILVLGGFYAAVAALFILFELIAVNYRPILIDGAVEASYPSSTTLLVMCVMPTAATMAARRISGRLMRALVTSASACFTVFTVALRLISGVHWLTDIVGGGLLAAGLCLMFAHICSVKR